MNQEIIKCIVNKEYIQLLNGDILSRNHIFYFHKDNNCNKCIFYDLYNNDNSYIKYNYNGNEKSCKFSSIKFNNYINWGWISIKHLQSENLPVIENQHFKGKNDNKNLDNILIKCLHEISEKKNDRITIKEILEAMNQYTDDLPTPKKIGSMIKKLDIGVGRKSHGIYKYQISGLLKDVIYELK
jgi:hypothetical protein